MDFQTLKAATDALVAVKGIAGDALAACRRRLIDSGDERIVGELGAVAPYRHRLYAAATSIALIAAEREEMRQEQEYWKERNRMRIVQARTVCRDLAEA